MLGNYIIMNTTFDSLIVPEFAPVASPTRRNRKAQAICAVSDTKLSSLPD